MPLSEETVERNRLVGKRIAHQRKNLGMTQKQLADALGLPYYTFISQVETGQATLPPSLWQKVASVLLMDPIDFSVQCLLVNEPEIYKQLFGKMKPSRVVARLANLRETEEKKNP